MALLTLSEHVSALFPAKRFTVDGSAGLEQQLARICEKARAELLALFPPDKLEAVLLGGGYGRGEGGVLITQAGDQPYNDLEFYVFLRGANWVNVARKGVGSVARPSSSSTIVISTACSGSVSSVQPEST